MFSSKRCTNILNRGEKKGLKANLLSLNKTLFNLKNAEKGN